MRVPLRIHGVASWSLGVHPFSSDQVSLAVFMVSSDLTELANGMQTEFLIPDHVAQLVSAPCGWKEGPMRIMDIWLWGLIPEATVLLPWVRVSRDTAVKMLARLQFSEGLIGARGSAFKLAHHVAVAQGFSSSPGGSLHRTVWVSSWESVSPEMRNAWGRKQEKPWCLLRPNHASSFPPHSFVRRKSLTPTCTQGERRWGEKSIEGFVNGVLNYSIPKQ